MIQVDANHRKWGSLSPDDSTLILTKQFRTCFADAFFT
uniref:Uncharacterized protein n=1 Tax=Anguilla anguilla TaxID=7936 RepID=A0A0E9P5U8_ANGAN